MTRRRVVVVGGGFAGLETTKRLAGAAVEITLIDRRNHHVFQPLLYQVATAGLNPSDIAYPIRAVVKRQDNVEVVLATVAGVDVDGRELRLEGGATVGYDTLVLAAGATHSYFGHDEWERVAPGLKTIEDALEIRRRVLLAFELAEQSDDPATRRALLTFVIVGAGPTGVELAGAISEIALKTLAGQFRRIDPTTARVVLVEGVDRVLSAYPPKLSANARRQLESLGVEVRTATMVNGIDETGVDTDEGRIDAHTVVWAAGVAASPLARSLGTPLDRAGRVEVDEHLAVPGHAEILVLGDLAAAHHNGELVPGVAPAAVQGGRHAAAVIEADLAGRPRPTFRYRDKGSLATIGRRAAVADFGHFTLSGLPAWTMWWAIHIAFLIGFRSRVLVMFSWMWSYLTFQRGARLITDRWRGGDRAGIAPTLESVNGPPVGRDLR